MQRGEYVVARDESLLVGVESGGSVGSRGQEVAREQRE